MRACVIGSGGFIGRALVRTLRSDGCEVAECSSRAPGGIDAQTGLLPSRFRIAEGTEVVYYLAQSDGLRRNPPRVDHLLTVNGASAAHVAALARDAGAGKFIYASTGNVYAPSFRALREADPVRRDNWYSLSKMHGEEAVALAGDGMRTTSARLFGVYGRGQRARLVPKLAASIGSGTPIRLDPHPEHPADQGGLRISLCHVEDVARILAALAHLNCPPVLNVAAPEVLSIRDIAVALGKNLGREPYFEMTGCPRSFDLIADTSALRQLVRYEFIPFAKGIEDTAQDLLPECR